ncbi:type III pantothenate kinase [Flavobacteriaceae bacterium]|nr:type III pantothenate kinase [Flavobacteriaceae bacterium]
MFLAIDIGNSSIKFGIFKEKKLLFNFAIQSDLKKDHTEYSVKIVECFLKNSFNCIDISRVAICSVVTELTEILKKAVNNFFTEEIYIIDQKSSINLPIKIGDNIDINEVGKDRLMTAIAAFKNFGGNLAVVDLGTATTIDIIGEKGEYFGGIITTGIDLSISALYESASLLPKIKFKKQQHVIGKNTIEAINSGIYFGHACLIEGMVKKMEAEYGHKLQIILTGGFSSILQKIILNSRLSANLSLCGLLVSYNYNNN